MYSAGTQRDFSPMTDSEFRMFCELIRSHCGLHFGPESRFLLEKRLARRSLEQVLVPLRNNAILRAASTRNPTACVEAEFERCV